MYAPWPVVVHKTHRTDSWDLFVQFSFPVNCFQPIWVTQSAHESGSSQRHTRPPSSSFPATRARKRSLSLGPLSRLLYSLDKAHIGTRAPPCGGERWVCVASYLTCGQQGLQAFPLLPRDTFSNQCPGCPGVHSAAVSDAMPGGSLCSPATVW